MSASAWYGAAPANLAAVGVMLGVSALIAALGRRWRGTRRERRLGAAVAAVAAAWWLASAAWYLLPERFSWAVSLPIQFCELAGVAAPVALLTRRRWAERLLYYWGLGFCTQAFASPVHDPGTMGYLFSFATHACVFVSACYVVAVRGYRPRGRDLWVAVGVSLGVMGVMFVLDALTGFNYGFVGRGHPGTATLVDSLGDWPLRVVWMVLIALGVFVGLTVPWLCAGGPPPARAGAPSA